MKIHWARVNMSLAIAWGVILPASVAFGFWKSVAFVSLASIYANIATHVAAYRADRPNA